MIEYTKERPLRVATAFSGYDSQKMALERLHKVFPDFCYELVAWSEIDENAIRSIIGGAIRCHAAAWLHRMPTAIVSQEDKAVQAVP